MSQTQDYDLPVTVDEKTAIQMLAKLTSGQGFSVEIDPETAPDLADQLSWQLENEQPITEFVEEYSDK